MEKAINLNRDLNLYLNNIKKQLFLNIKTNIIIIINIYSIIENEFQKFDIS